MKQLTPVHFINYWFWYVNTVECIAFQLMCRMQHMCGFFVIIIIIVSPFSSDFHVYLYDAQAHIFFCCRFFSLCIHSYRAWIHIVHTSIIFQAIEIHTYKRFPIHATDCWDRHFKKKSQHEDQCESSFFQRERKMCRQFLVSLQSAKYVLFMFCLILCIFLRKVSLEVIDLDLFHC